ncbi:MAG: hypothetical protein IT308_11330 [Anaerolineaceae bacterium]|nr:hypothetical protein [Anaerolineaceae bacterium]
MSSYNRWIILTILLFLSACQPQQSLPAPLPTPLLWETVYTPELAWLEPALYGCTSLTPKVGLITHQIPFSRLESEKADITLIWGENPDNWSGQTYLLGYDEWVIILHPQNPQPLLALSVLGQIYAGKRSNWGDVFTGSSNDQKIEVWEYPAGNILRELFASQIGNPGFNPEAMLAPNPKAMLEAISSNPNAIGYAPRRWINEGVKIVPIEGLDAALTRHPILANTPTEPGETLRSWLVCIQQSIQGAN